ncbi:hypothetical protein SDC9_89792 [bioreactor metagenome]|uniref:Uncharacterized protein n=1 Tax=bioreactor metagenome TaxID=1076179 RepID=A0A644ZQ60_9ZZZZ
MSVRRPRPRFPLPQDGRFRTASVPRRGLFRDRRGFPANSDRALPPAAACRSACGGSVPSPSCAGGCCGSVPDSSPDNNRADWSDGSGCRLPESRICRSPRWNRRLSFPRPARPAPGRRRRAARAGSRSPAPPAAGSSRCGPKN